MEVLSALHRASQTATQLFAENDKTKESKVTISQAFILGAVKATPGVNQTTLVQSTGIDRSTLADVVKRLVKRGWLQRKRDRQDTRAYIVDITPEGRNVLKAAEAAAGKVEKELAAKFPGVKHLANGHS